MGPITKVRLPIIRIFDVKKNLNLPKRIAESQTAWIPVQRRVFPAKHSKPAAVRNRIWKSEKYVVLEKVGKKVLKKFGQNGIVGKKLDNNRRRSFKSKACINEYIKECNKISVRSISLESHHLLSNVPEAHPDLVRDLQSSLKLTFLDEMAVILDKDISIDDDNESSGNDLPDTHKDKIQRTVSSGTTTPEHGGTRTNPFAQNTTTVTQEVINEEDGEYVPKHEKLQLRFDNPGDVLQKPFDDEDGLSEDNVSDDEEIFDDEGVTSDEELFDSQKIGYTYPDGSYTIKAANFHADQYVKNEFKKGGARKTGDLISAFSEEFCGVEMKTMSATTVFRAVMAKGIIIDDHFFNHVLPNLKDIAICTDGTTLRSLHFDQFFLLGWLGDELWVYCIDIKPTLAKTGKAIAAHIVQYIKTFQKRCKEFDVKNIHYFLADHCSNNSGVVAGAIAHLQKIYSWLKFNGCKDHLCNLLVKVFNKVATAFVSTEYPQCPIKISNTTDATNCILQTMKKIFNFIGGNGGSHGVDFKKFSNGLCVPKPSMNRYLTGTTCFKFLRDNDRAVRQFLEENSYKKNQKTANWAKFLNHCIMKTVMNIGTFLHYQLRKYLGKFHETKEVAAYSVLLADMKSRFQKIADNPEAILTMTIDRDENYIKEKYPGDELRVYEKYILEKTFSNIVKVIEKHETMKMSNTTDTNYMVTNTRIIESSFGDIAPAYEKNKRFRPILVTQVQKIRHYPKEFNMLQYVTDDLFVKYYRPMARKQLDKAKSYSKTISKLSKAKKYTGRNKKLSENGLKRAQQEFTWVRPPPPKPKETKKKAKKKKKKVKKKKKKPTKKQAPKPKKRVPKRPRSPQLVIPAKPPPKRRKLGKGERYTATEWNQLSEYRKMTATINGQDPIGINPLQRLRNTKRALARQSTRNSKKIKRNAPSLIRMSDF